MTFFRGRILTHDMILCLVATVWLWFAAVYLSSSLKPTTTRTKQPSLYPCLRPCCSKFHLNDPVYMFDAHQNSKREQDIPSKQRISPSSKHALIKAGATVRENTGRVKKKRKEIYTGSVSQCFSIMYGLVFV